ncbi:hypothetical protein [Arthrobacter sp. HS15c]|uniref:hypothetical protein n=1 Tax=Arthrobacter sp. HS15c TaxID=3230279 RepID=UPI0034660143
MACGKCPDLFPLPLDGDPENLRWVHTVNLNPGGPNAGSAGQYFVGDFDGTTFTSANTVTEGSRIQPGWASTSGWTGAGTTTPPSPSAMPPITAAS